MKMKNERFIILNVSGKHDMSKQTWLIQRLHLAKQSKHVVFFFFFFCLHPLVIVRNSSPRKRSLFHHASEIDPGKLMEPEGYLSRADMFISRTTTV